MIVIMWLGALLLALAMYLWEVYSRFSRYGVAYMKPTPILGNMCRVTLRKCHLAEDVQKLYNAFPNERFLGRFELMSPVVVLRDLDLIKKVTVKDFENFLDHRSMVDDTVDPLFGRNLFSLKGHEWKDMRATLSPAFTSSKMRAMVPFMVDVNNQMIRVLKKKIEAVESSYIDTDSKDLTTRYTNDVIASCAFGIKVDSFTETNNEIYLHGKSTAHFGFRRILVYLGYCSFPSIMKKLNIKFLEEEANDFFRDLFKNALIEWQTKNLSRPDMIHFLLAAKKAWSDTDLCAQAILFFVAGFETVSSAMCFLLHELALNPDVQNRLVQEFRENEAKSNGTFDYDSIQSLMYLDMVVSEVLRLWPPAVGLDRMCVKDYNLGKPNDKTTRDFILRKGELITVPTWSLHRDPEYFPNPNKFDPERFSNKNKADIKPFTYIPFGLGPRNCIGSRFAVCEIKVMVYQLLLQLEVSPSVKTRIPTKLATDAFTLAIEGGHWVRFKLRT